MANLNTEPAEQTEHTPPTSNTILSLGEWSQRIGNLPRWLPLFLFVAAVALGLGYPAAWPAAVIPLLLAVLVVAIEGLRGGLIALSIGTLAILLLWVNAPLTGSLPAITFAAYLCCGAAGIAWGEARRHSERAVSRRFDHIPAPSEQPNAAVPHLHSKEPGDEPDPGMPGENDEIVNRAKAEFLASVSHELRTPMYGIVGMTELALHEELSPTVREYLETTRSSAETLLQMVNEILDYSNLQGGRLDLERAPFSLPAMLDETIKKFSVNAAEKGLELACDIAPSVPDNVIGDANRLRQVLMSLLSNAIKFTDRGEVVLRVNVDALSEDQVGVLLEVEDTGIGISRANQQRVFAPFTRLDSSNTRRHGGTGLGLAVASQVVRAMGGRLQVKSRLGQGSTFSFQLALVRDATGLEPPQGSATNAGLKDARVLVVDDSATQLAILDRSLRHWGMRPTMVRSGPDCMVALRQATDAGETFRVVIVDGHMPGVDSVALIEAIRKNASGAPAIIAMLAGSSPTARQQYDNADAIIEKPVSAEALWSALNDVTQDARADRPKGVTPSAAPLRSAQPLRVLLAEDTIANQKIVKSLLNKRGHDVEIAHNGREVVEMVRSRPFDIVLMDVQMPTMDGLQATSAIRAIEGQLGRHVPIVAITAHVLHGDRERCLAAGMDAYLAKPINNSHLIRTVETLSARQNRSFLPVGRMDSKPRVERDSGDTKATRAACDVVASLARLGQDRTLFENLLEFFFEDCRPLAEQLAQAVQDADAPAVRRMAHSLRGLLENFDAHEASGVATGIERAGRDDQLADAAQLLEPLKHAITRVEDSLRPYRARAD